MDTTHPADWLKQQAKARCKRSIDAVEGQQPPEPAIETKRRDWWRRVEEIRSGGGGPILVSIDSGDTWTRNGGPATNWSSIASSADGNKLVAVVNGGGIWTLQSTTAPSLGITRANLNIVLSWIVPSIDLRLQENSELDTTSWTDVTNRPTLNSTNLQNEVVLAEAPRSRFYRLKH